MKGLWRSKLADWDEFQRKLEPGDILLTSPKPTHRTGLGGAFDRTFGFMSRQVQGSDKTHSLIYTGNGNVVEARIGRGVRNLPLTRAIGALDATALRPTNATAEQRAIAAQKARAMVKEKPRYAMKGIAKALLREHNLPNLVGTVNGVICSDLITRSYDQDITTKPRDAVLPVDFARSTHMMTVGEHHGRTNPYVAPARTATPIRPRAAPLTARAG